MLADAITRAQNMQQTTSSSHTSDSPGCGTLCCGFLFGLACTAGLSAGFGAAAGAIGYQVMATNGWTVAGIGYIDMVNSMAAGAAVISPIHLCSLRCNSDDAENPQQSNLIVTLAISGAMGAVHGLAGAGMLQLLTSNTQMGFVAAAGATGNAIILLSILGTVGILAAGTICCSGLINGEPRLITIPTRPGEKCLIIDPVSLGLPIHTANDMIKFVNGVMAQKIQTPENEKAPEQAMGMNRLSVV